MKTYVYDPKLVTLMANGYHVTGFSEDSMIDIEKEEERNLQYNGVMGEHGVARNANENYMLTISLSNSSPSVSMFRQLARDEKVFFPVSIVNMNDDAEDISTENAYIVEEPGYKVNKEIEDNEVTIRLVNPKFS